jgi:hypothetical protein
MKNENDSRWPGRANLFANNSARQACTAARRLRLEGRLTQSELNRGNFAPQPPASFASSKRQKNVWKAPVTAEYLQALREADELVFQAILRGATLRHSARVLKAA